MLQAKIKCPCCGHSITVNAVNADEVGAQLHFRSVRAGEVNWLEPEESAALWKEFDKMFKALDDGFKSIFDRKFWRRR